MSRNGYKKVRLVKVLVQPVIVLDDGEELEEKTVQPIQVPASEWESYPAKLAEELRHTEKEINDSSAAEAGIMGNDAD